MMLEGKCLRCGSRYYGWALGSPRKQTCESCGGALEVSCEKGKPFTGYSYFATPKYKSSLLDCISFVEDHWGK
jgi:hypothetical protein